VRTLTVRTGALPAALAAMALLSRFKSTCWICTTSP